ncbi:60S ribosomal protein L4-like [Vitis riparia]|uniref:60S ribosomal protein L4-like n=1 Tax=Vitis riparia TaxID=96939 RepID=UPI00155AE4F8|nr:60S ribosomal protein L4-like [Vitis riparia]
MATDGGNAIPLPDVMKTYTRPNIVNFIHSNTSKNSCGGFHRASQDAFRNMCRGGRIFAPTKIWRHCHRKMNVNQKQYAVVSAIATLAVPSLMMARGHKIEPVLELPLVIGDSTESVDKTSTTIDILKQVGGLS